MLLDRSRSLFPCRCREAIWEAERRRVGTRCSLSRWDRWSRCPCIPCSPGSGQVPVAAVTISMETGPAQPHPGDRGRGGRGDASPSPRGHGDAASVKMEIPQVPNVRRNPKEANWFFPPHTHPSFNACWLSLCTGNCCSAPIKGLSRASHGLGGELILHTCLFWGAWEFIQDAECQTGFPEA